MTPGVGPYFDPKGKIGRIYVELHMTNIQALCHAVAEKIFSYISIISLW